MDRRPRAILPLCLHQTLGAGSRKRRAQLNSALPFPGSTGVLCSSPEASGLLVYIPLIGEAAVLRGHQLSRARAPWGLGVLLCFLLMLKYRLGKSHLEPVGQFRGAWTPTLLVHRTVVKKGPK